MLNRFIHALCLFTLPALSAVAASSQEFNRPTDIDKALPSVSFQSERSLLQAVRAPGQTAPEYVLVKKSGTENTSSLPKLMSNKASRVQHERFIQTYHGLRIIGSELVRHTKANKHTVTGRVYNGIEQDLPSLVPALSSLEALSIARAHSSYQVSAQEDQAELAIYIEPNMQQAHLIYEVVHRGVEAKQWVEYHTFIDAKTGQVLKAWDNVPHYSKRLEGQGGSSWRAHQGTSLQRPNTYQFVTNPSKPYEFGPLEIEQVAETCYLETRSTQGRAQGVTTYPMDNQPLDDLFAQLEKVNMYLPLSYENFAVLRELPTAHVDCRGLFFEHFIITAFSKRVELHSQEGDAHYFATQTQHMFEDWYGLYPFASRVFLVPNIAVANAFAIPSEDKTIPDQVFIGNGIDSYEGQPMAFGAGMATSDIISHELGHLVTGRYSNLTYDDQSGGLNESFSDMTAMAFQDYLYQAYPWASYSYFIGSQNWLYPPYYLRSMERPEDDGWSISQASDYNQEIDVHGSSGVFNKVFYNLAERHQFGVKKAYQVMLTANMHYWTADSTFVQAACGMLSAAEELGYTSNGEKNAVAASLREQGLSCH
jgi:pseudolysin